MVLGQTARSAPAALSSMVIGQRTPIQSTRPNDRVDALADWGHDEDTSRR